MQCSILRRFLMSNSADGIGLFCLQQWVQQYVNFDGAIHKNIKEPCELFLWCFRLSFKWSIQHMVVLHNPSCSSRCCTQKTKKQTNDEYGWVSNHKSFSNPKTNLDDESGLMEKATNSSLSLARPRVSWLWSRWVSSLTVSELHSYHRQDIQTAFLCWATSTRQFLMFLPPKAKEETRWRYLLFVAGYATY